MSTLLMGAGMGLMVAISLAFILAFNMSRLRWLMDHDIHPLLEEHGLREPDDGFTSSGAKERMAAFHSDVAEALAAPEREREAREWRRFTVFDPTVDKLPLPAGPLPVRPSDGVLGTRHLRGRRLGVRRRMGQGAEETTRGARATLRLVAQRSPRPPRPDRRAIRHAQTHRTRRCTHPHPPPHQPSRSLQTSLQGSHRQHGQRRNHRRRKRKRLFRFWRDPQPPPHRRLQTHHTSPPISIPLHTKTGRANYLPVPSTREEGVVLRVRAISPQGEGFSCTVP